MTTLRILNLNIWNYNAPWPERRARIVGLIQDTQPDLVALQEVRYHDWLPYPNHQADQIRLGLLDQFDDPGAALGPGGVIVPDVEVEDAYLGHG